MMVIIIFTISLIDYLYTYEFTFYLYLTAFTAYLFNINTLTYT